MPGSLGRPSRRWLTALTIRQRLVAFGVVASIVAGGAAWNTMSSFQKATSASETAADLSSVQLYHQDAVNKLWAIRNNVLEAVLVGQGLITRTPTQLSAELSGYLESFERDHELISSMTDDFDTSATLPSVDTSQSLFLEQSVQLAALATTDAPAALAALDKYLANADVLFADLDETTSIVAGDAATATAASKTSERGAMRDILIATAVGTILIVVLTVTVARSISRQIRRLTKVTRAMAAGDLAARNDIGSNDQLGDLARGFDEMADSLEELVGRLEREGSQDAFRRRLFDAFDMASDEDDVRTIVQDAMALIDETPMELLLSDSSRHHVSEVVPHPTSGAPGCPVDSIGQCVAVRRGHRLVFESGSEIDACPHLKRRETTCSAVCVPITFNGRALGVLHATGADLVAPDPRVIDRLAALATQTGARLGTISAFQGAREQAAIDGLTGLSNRRTLENEVRSLSAQAIDYSLVMADLDRFKSLNDHYGHEAGDKALRLFSQVLQETTRDDDIVARLGGEEFVIVQPRMTSADAIATVERIQLALATRLEISDSPIFTSSFGVADTSLGTGFDAVLRIADAGLLAAKGQGRNCWVEGDLELASRLSSRGRPRGMAGNLLDNDPGPESLPERV